MRIQFCGANRTVTGSCHLLEINGLRILLDVGMYQGARDEARRINQYLPEDARSPDVVILSHGHLDHCGKLPVLTRSGGNFNGPIYCTPATAEVARIVLTDAAEIQEEDAKYLNRRHDPAAPPIEPLYRPGDIPGLLRLLRRVGYGVRTEIGNGVSFTFYDAGHILGSAYVLLEWDEAGARRTLLFTADIGRYNTPILRDPHPLPGAVDFVITESTYGNAAHAPVVQIEPQLLDAVRHCVERRSRLIVPSFAIGRTQTVLWYVQKFVQDGAIPSIPVFVDSPMGVEASKAYGTFRENYDDQTNEMIGRRDLFGLSRVTFAASSQQSRGINNHKGACVIIASSPTCEFGRVLHHVKHSIEQPDDLIVFVGWLPPNTLGRRLQDAQRKVRIHDRWYELRCGVRTIHGLSAHADGDELLRFLEPTLTPRTTAYVVHGEVPQAEGFAQRLLEAGVGSALVPAMESSFIAYAGDLDALKKPAPVPGKAAGPVGE